MVLSRHPTISAVSGLSVANLGLKGAEKAEFIEGGTKSIALWFQSFIISQRSLSDGPDDMLID